MQANVQQPGTLHQNIALDSANQTNSHQIFSISLQLIRLNSDRGSSIFPISARAARSHHFLFETTRFAVDHFRGVPRLAITVFMHLLSRARAQIALSLRRHPSMFVTSVSQCLKTLRGCVRCVASPAARTALYPDFQLLVTRLLLYAVSKLLFVVKAETQVWHSSTTNAWLSTRAKSCLRCARLSRFHRSPRRAKVHRCDATDRIDSGAHVEPLCSNVASSTQERALRQICTCDEPQGCSLGGISQSETTPFLDNVTALLNLGKLQATTE